MRSVWFLTALLPLLFGACQAPPSSLTPIEKGSIASEVRQVVAALTDAMNSHDPELVLSHYRESEEFVYVGCTDPMFGSETFSTLVRPYYQTRTDVTFRQEILRVQVLGPTTAVATIRGDSSETEALFWTYVLVREAGSWVIAHVHESWPGCADPPPLHPTGTVEGLRNGSR